MISNDQINYIYSKIIQGINPDKIILFGSYATGTSNDESDLDLIIVKNSDLPRHKRGMDVQRLFYGYLVPMDFKIYTPQEFDQDLQNKYSFLSSVISNSKLIYERQS